MPGIYHYLWLFLAFSVVGWCFETILVSLQEKKFVNRGFLTGPMCPIYGFGICLVVLALSPLPKTWYVLFFGGGVIAAALEYFVGWLLEKLFKQRWWDYSDHRFNLRGRIALPETLLWAPLAVLAMRYFVPWFTRLADSISRPVGWSVLGAVTLIAAADITLILGRMNSFARMADALRERTEALRERTEELREVVEESYKFVIEERKANFNSRRDKFDTFLRRRIAGAFPMLSERWKIDEDDNEE